MINEDKIIKARQKEHLVNLIGYTFLVICSAVLLTYIARAIIRGGGN